MRVKDMLRASMIDIFLITLFLSFKLCQAAQYYVLGDNVNVRYQPSLSSAVTFQLNNGVQVEIEREQKEWYRIFLPNEPKKKGWVFSDFIGSWYILQWWKDYNALKDALDQIFRNIEFYERKCQEYDKAKAVISELDFLNNSIRLAFPDHLPQWHKELPSHTYIQMESLKQACE